MKKALKVSIVIPAYNEQDHIGACLEAIAEMDVKPHEVIVVDNCSTDNTVKIAEQFPYVTIVKEMKPGVVHARSCGYDYASGDILGRIDVDTLLPRDWVSKLQSIFLDEDIQAVSGGLHFYDIGWNQLIDSIDAYWRAWMARRMSKNSRIFLLGANMAIRKEAWVKVKRTVCAEKGVHEDLDLALHLSDAGLKVVFDPTLVANVSARRIDTNLVDLTKYALSNPQTYFKHRAKEHIYMYPIITIALTNYLLLRFLFRAYDKTNRHVSFKLLLLSQSAARVNPAENL